MRGAGRSACQLGGTELLPLHLYDGSEDVPEVALRIGKLDSDIPFATSASVNGNDASLAFLGGVTVHKENFLAALKLRGEWQEPSVQVHSGGDSNFAEGMVFRCPSIDSHGNRKWQALAAALFLHHLCPQS